MFTFKLHSKQTTKHSNHWFEQLEVARPQKRIVKRTHTQPYHAETLAESIHHACMKSFGFSGEAETTALQVVCDIEQWLHNKEEVTASDIKRKAALFLQKYNPRAAYEYLPIKELEVREDEYGFVRL